MYTRKAIYGFRTVQIWLKYRIVHSRITIHYYRKIAWIHARKNWKLFKLKIAGQLMKLAVKVSPELKTEIDKVFLLSRYTSY